MDRARINQLNKRFNDVLHGRVTVDPRNFNHFLEGICIQEDPAKCVDNLISNPPGLPSIQNAMRFDLSLSFINGLATKTLEYLLRAVDLGGGLLDHILFAIVEPPIFWSAFAQGFQSGSLTEKAQVVFAKILDRLIGLKDKDASSYRKLASEPSVINKLLESSEHEVREVAHHIKHVLAACASGSVLSGPCAPGGRHDNDFPNFRDIFILPTTDEILSTQPPFIRPAYVLDDPAGSDTRVADYLDNTFRMLREDMIYDMREDLQIAQKKKPGRSRGLDIKGLTMVDIYTGSQDRGTRWGLVLRCHRDLQPLQALKDVDDRKAFLSGDPAGSKILRNQSLACLIADGDIVSFATVLRVEALLAKKPPEIVLLLEGEASTSKALLRLSTAKQVQLLQIDTALFAYEPVLKALKNMQLVPLSEELLFWEDGQIPRSSPAQAEEVVEKLSANPSTDLQSVLSLSKSIRLESSQAKSLLAGLCQRVALIQGLPGTGKSFIGALLAKAIHDHTSQTMLVVCYTNHALDQFLEDLIGIGIAADSIVRIGGRASPSVQHLSLQSQNLVKQPRSKAEWTLIEQAKARSGFLVGRLQDSFQALQQADTTISLDDVLTYIEFEDSEYWEAFQIPLAPDGSQFVGKKGKGKPVRHDMLLYQWMNGWDAGIFKHHPDILRAANIWNMDKPSRQALFDKWKGEIIKGLVADICNVGRDYNNAQDELARRFGDNTLAFLKQKRIIGCTTTGAAKNAADLAAVGTDVLLVEEAGEILESHILTALGEKTSQMILIGDHKQLRPKVNNYQLTVEKQEGFDLNRSLFERLVLKGYPHQTLTTQHRMRPEISAFIRELTYPELVDHPSTQNRPNIRGVQSNVIFINHDHPEDEEQRIKDRRDAESTSSKQNTYEAEMVLKIVHYLKQQGYKSKDMVILTPYLGQLVKLRQALQNDDPVLNDLDAGDLQKAGLGGQKGSVANKAHQPGVRLATIDNYQGEESNIVIASLTRSNSDNSIGFMTSPERLNVLLSRARDGMILIGNSHTFLNSKKGGALWGKFFSLLDKNSYVYEGFPIKCERHPAKTAIIAQSDEFDVRAPDGGCSEPCGIVLKCFHACPKKCHPVRTAPGQPDIHTSMLCMQQYQEKCSAGAHMLSWKCHQGRPATCSACDRLAKRLEKQAQLDLKAQEQREKAQREHDLKMMELQAKLQYQQEALNDIQAQKDREDEIKQKQKEIEDMKKNISKAETAAKQAAAKANQPPQNLSQDAGNNSAPSTSAPAAPHRPMFPSAARDKWEHQKRVDGVTNDAIDKIMDMTGLEQVKEQILRIKGSLDTMRRQGVPIDKERINLVLLGNPGTGKTTVARLYAEFLESIQALPGNAFLETTGSKLAYEGVQGAQKLIDDALKAGGGAIFIDEAYQLVTGTGGKQVLDFLLAEMENRVGTLVFILAGYSKEMEKFFEHNPGLPSRVPYQLTFADYTDQELMAMLEDLVQKRYNGRMNVEDGVKGLYARIAIKRLGRGRGRPGFGNARALQNMFAKIRERQAERIEKQRRSGMQGVDDFLLTKEDLIGPDPSQVLPNSAPWAKLQGLIGLESVKDSVRNFFALLETNYQRELAEKEPMQVSLNRVFLGSPGTGKTSVAKLYGQILADLGMLSNGEVVIKNPADFVGAHLGESEKNTKSILESTRGKVLVIDEAYMLYSKNATDPYKTSVIDTMVAEIQSVPGEDRCVLLLGYKEQMEEMFQNVNPGLARRFAIENAFNFEDFTEPQLMKILEYKLKDQDLSATNDAKEVAREQLSRMKNRPNFGNAGEVENLLGQAKARYQKRMASVPASERMDVVFEPQDIDPDFNRGQNASTNLAKMFADIVGCEEVIRKLDGYQKIARAMKEKGLDMRTQIPSNFVFKGPPGTGKTTTARKLGQVYYDMGFLSSTDVIECSATDLVGQYVGHTGPKTKGVFEKALGKVLFIDEAYRLSEGHFAKEAMDEIVGLMTHERFVNKLVIILAGYDHQMNSLLAVNPGLSSRFSEEIVFQNMSSEQCLELLDKELQKNRIAVPELSDKNSQTYVEMQDAINQMSALPSWGNGRDVKTLGKRLTQQAFANMANGGTSELLSAEEALRVTRAMLQEQLARQRVAHKASFSGSMPTASMDGPAPPPPSMSTSTNQASKSAPPPPPAPPKQKGPKNAPQADPSTKRQRSKRPPKTNGPPGGGDGPPNNRVARRDAGVSDAVWDQLQADIAAEERAKKRAAEEEQRLAEEVKKAEQRKQVARDRAAVLERALAAAKDNIERQREIQQQLAEARRREEEVRVARERAAAALRKKQQEEEEKRRKALEMQRKLEQLGVCPMGYQWIKQASGYRCAGGSHFLSNGQIGLY